MYIFFCAFAHTDIPMKKVSNNIIRCDIVGLFLLIDDEVAERGPGGVV